EPGQTSDVGAAPNGATYGRPWRRASWAARRMASSAMTPARRTVTRPPSGRAASVVRARVGHERGGAIVVSARTAGSGLTVPLPRPGVDDGRPAPPMTAASVRAGETVA